MRRRVLRVLGGVACLGVLGPVTVSAQHPPEASIGLDVRRDRIEYHFDNPSTFDTAAPVPHFFEQRYAADNVWLTATVRYTAGPRWETLVAAAPGRDTTADDYDTFQEPDGVTVVSGTTGPARMWGLRVEQRAAFGPGGGVGSGVRVTAGYRFRLDHADFGVGHKTVTRQGAVVQAFDVTSPETTRSEVQELFAGVSLARTLAARWRLALAGEGSPLVVGRLVVQLPEKYPGQDLAFVATGLGARGRATLRREAGRWPIELAADAGTSWSYRSTDRLRLTTAGIHASIARRW